MSYVCVQTPGRVTWFESEQHYYDGQPTITLTFDPKGNVWWGRSHHPTPPSMTPSVGEVFLRLTNNPWAGVSDQMTHSVAEPGAPLEPIIREQVPA